ncbi:DUF429 domain-containing protein [Candidatus Palauibacter sp.]|uniref:DUF429 domain-containing protein n=1 Tax=Candidatus Palauibacter sp. TaxID=3101350 RepID=UPI003D134B2C
MHVVGVDLSGPVNSAATAIVSLRRSGDALRYEPRWSRSEADDAAIHAVVREASAADEVVVGLDAPLSYNVGGGSRKADKELRARIVKEGMQPGSVMAPTAPRMAYLTPRGIAVARLLASMDEDRPPKIVEVHPGAVFTLGGAPLEDVMSLKTEQEARRRLLRWLGNRGLSELPPELAESDHSVAACGAALAAWRWACGESSWLYPAEPPHHPYDFAC